MPDKQTVADPRYDVADHAAGRTVTDRTWRTVTGWPRDRRQKRPTGRRTVTICVLTLVVLGIYCIVVPAFSDTDPRVVDLGAYLEVPSGAHLMGTDLLGRDLLVRCAQALRISLLLAAAAAVLSTVLGVLVGTLAAAFGGLVDKFVMRSVDALNSLPHLLLGVVIASLWRGQWWAIVASIGITHWTQIARIVRSEILSLRGREHVAAAVVSGASRRQVWATHLIPAVVPQALLAVVLTLPHAIWHESALSFLGVGLPPNDPSLGTLLEDAREGILGGGWWLLVFPAALLTAACLAVAGLGGRLREKSIPKRAIEAEVTR
ncbi:peptide/nickel transport system permease protein [Antricoccus suffuscus]|uniref:Peptide/nickel transport system permease protein n=1 Tax=Antricoccus suffuscus TaxID=1629062 RepID=A0A2T1A3T9_9ACTN|nr:ABC transporter permease [Antricoccus suffuscus]PRZ43147.1 peptide/nickel transport system permease protein [Antricoccus suffuscus]